MAHLTSADVSIAMAGAGDPRHIIHTIGHLKRSEAKRSVSIFVFEKDVEVIARHILLLHVAFDDRMGFRGSFERGGSKFNGLERAELYLEIFGNALVKEKTAEYLDDMADRLSKYPPPPPQPPQRRPRFLTQGTGPLAKYFDVSLLKFKVLKIPLIIF
jgi:hypothetical protein